MTPAPGAVIDGYTLDRLVHRGNMSELWRVEKADLAFPIVMKLPRIGYGYDAAAIVGFEVEQMILPALSGPHVPRFVAAGDFSGQPHIVMEYVAGTSLRRRLDEAPLPAAEVAALGAAVADALHDIHTQHVIHLDVKPSNVIIAPDGHAVLIDFGLARHDRLPDLLAEEFERPMGTAPYMAPEQVVQVRSDLRSDIYALGVMLYHLTTGQRPFGNPTTVLGLKRRFYRDAAPPRALAPDCPPWLQEVVLRCIETDANARYDTAAQVAFDLRHPDQVALTARAARTRRDTLPRVARRWLGIVTAASEPRPPAHECVVTAPIVMLAVDVSGDHGALSDALRADVTQLLEARPRARLACVTVMKRSRIAMDAETDAHGVNLHVKHLAELKHWARAIAVAANRVTFHVLEAPDPAAALVAFARANHVAHIVIGARASSALRRYLGSVSSQVVAEAPCSVTVVRAPAEAHISPDASAASRAS